MDLKKVYGFSKKLAEGGARMIIGPDEENDFLLVRRIPNDSYKARMSVVMMANKKQLDILKAQDEKAHAAKDAEIFCEVLADTVLIGWGSGITMGGEVLNYSTEEAKRLLLELPELRSDIVDFATSKVNYPLEPDVEDIKKS